MADPSKTYTGEELEELALAYLGNLLKQNPVAFGEYLQSRQPVPEELSGAAGLVTLKDEHGKPWAGPMGLLNGFLQSIGVGKLYALMRCSPETGEQLPVGFCSQERASSVMQARMEALSIALGAGQFTEGNEDAVKALAEFHRLQLQEIDNQLLQPKDKSSE